MIRLLAAGLFATLLAGTALAQTPATPHQPAPSTSVPAKAAAAPAAKSAGAMAEGETAAKARCMGDPVVWGNPASKAYHLPGAKTYGTTKKGSYMCRKEAEKAGYHEAGKKKPATTAPAAKTN